jgi:nucleoside-diphosphate-sugar epimerase
MESNKLNLLIVGANGKLGRWITRFALNENSFNVNVLIRNDQKEKKLLSDVEQRGGRVFHGELNQPDTLKDVTKGIHTIISVVQGDEKTIFDGQMNLLQDAVRNGVKRFVPSDYGIDYSKIDKNENAQLNYRLRFREELKKTNVRGLFIQVGLYMETLMLVHDKNALAVYEDSDRRYNLTSLKDTARYVVEAVKDPNRTGDLRISGDFLSIQEISDKYEKIRGKKMNLKKTSDFKTLDKMIEDARKIDNQFESTMLSFASPVFHGRGIFSDFNNSSFPSITPTRFEDWLRDFNESDTF